MRGSKVDVTCVVNGSELTATTVYLCHFNVLCKATSQGWRPSCSLKTSEGLCRALSDVARLTPKWQQGPVKSQNCLINFWNLGKLIYLQKSQNHRIFGVGRDLCGSSSPPPLPKQTKCAMLSQNIILLFGDWPQLNFWLCRRGQQFLKNSLVRKSANFQQKTCFSSLHAFCLIGPLCSGFFAPKCHKILLTTHDTSVHRCSSVVPLGCVSVLTLFWLCLLRLQQNPAILSGDLHHR